MISRHSYLEKIYRGSNIDYTKEELKLTRSLNDVDPEETPESHLKVLLYCGILSTVMICVGVAQYLA